MREDIRLFSGSHRRPWRGGLFSEVSLQTGSQETTVEVGLSPGLQPSRSSPWDPRTVNHPGSADSLSSLTPASRE